MSRMRICFPCIDPSHVFSSLTTHADTLKIKHKICVSVGPSGERRVFGSDQIITA